MKSSSNRARTESGRIGRFARAFRAFTLVELIVVITILAILATVGFLTLSGYTDDARSATVAANVRTVYSAILTESTTSGNSPRYYVDHDPAAALSGGIVFVDGGAVALTGGQWGSGGTNYSAGNPRWDRLKMNGDKFRLSAVLRGMLGTAGFAQPAQAAYDTGAVSVGAFDYVGKAGVSGKARTAAYFQVVGVSPSTKKASVTGNYAAAGTGAVLGLVDDPSSGSSTGAIVDSATVSSTGTVVTDPTTSGISPTLLTAIKTQWPGTWKKCGSLSGGDIGSWQTRCATLSGKVGVLMIKSNNPVSANVAYIVKNMASNGGYSGNNAYEIWYESDRNRDIVSMVDGYNSSSTYGLLPGNVSVGWCGVGPCFSYGATAESSGWGGDSSLTLRNGTVIGGSDWTQTTSNYSVSLYDYEIFVRQ